MSASILMPRLRRVPDLPDWSGQDGITQFVDAGAGRARVRPRVQHRRDDFTVGAADVTYTTRRWWKARRTTTRYGRKTTAPHPAGLTRCPPRSRPSRPPPRA